MFSFCGRLGTARRLGTAAVLIYKNTNTMAETEEERRQRIRLKQDLLITIQKRRDGINDAARRLGWLAASFNIEVKASPIDFKEVEEAFKVGYSDRVKKDIKDCNGRLH